MAHPREAVISKVVELLLNRTDAGAKVVQNRVRPVEPGELPTILVYGKVEPVNWRRELPLDRNLTVSVEILAEADDECDTVLNKICAQVEEVLCEDDNLRGEVNNWIFNSTTLSLVKEAAFPQGSAVLDFTANFFTRKITGQAIPI